MIARLEDHEIVFHQVSKKQDADDWLLKQFRGCQPKLIFIDAPLSLPKVYSDRNGEDYFYRDADRALSAMSPMFLGGLTARAMRLAAILQQAPVEIKETYPGYLAKKILQLDHERYKKDESYLIEATASIIQAQFPFKVPQAPQNWHQFDAFLAFYSAWRYTNGQSVVFGTVEEGVITV